MNIVILLPYKENYTYEIAGAASIWVSDHNKYSKFSKTTTIFGNLHPSKKPLTKNFINIPIKTKLFSKTQEYTNSFLKLISNKHIDVIEVHNRPESIHIIKKNNIDSKLILVFHNNPLELSGSKTVSNRLFLLNNCYKIFFVSNWVKNKFFYNLPFSNKNNCEVVCPGVELIKHFPKKKKLIIFSGKLNNSKGFDLFSEALPPLLNKNHDWKALVIGSEPREKIPLSHPRVKLLGWVSYKDALNYYKKASIAIVPSKWDEPFGRTAMETAAYGCLTIISNNGGLKETFKVQNELILKKTTKNHLIKILSKVLKNKNYLHKIQKDNFNNPIHDIKKKVSFVDEIKSKTQLKLNFFNKKNLKLLHIGNFNEKNSHRLFNISIANKISSGLIKNDVDVINFDYRNYNSLLKKTEEKIIEIINNYRPDILLFGHNNILSRSSLEFIKDKKIKTSLWFEDALHSKGPDYKSSIDLIEKNFDLIDNYFITTCPTQIKTLIPKTKLSFIPIPADPNIENLKIYSISDRYKDIFFGMSHGVNYGKLKRNFVDTRESFINSFIDKNKYLSFELLGMHKEEPKWGYNFYDSLSNCKMALNLSRGEPVKYYSSNRIASFVANGMPTLIDEKTLYRDFFDDNELIFYKNIDHLSEIVNDLKKNNKLLNKIGKNGKSRYLKIFNNVKVAKYIINTIINKTSYNFLTN